jgi:HlyD family secretion protein
VTAEIETRYRTNVLCVPIQSVTTRMPKDAKGKDKKDKKDKEEEVASARPENGKKKGDAKKPAEVIFVLGSDYVHLKPVKRGISDDSYVEIIEGAEEGQEVISGGYKAINRELEDGRKIKKGEPKKGEKKDGSDEK